MLRNKYTADIKIQNKEYSMFRMSRHFGHNRKVLKELLCTLFFILLFNQGHHFCGAQPPSLLDSLKFELTKPMEDTSRVKVLNALANHFSYINTDSAIYTATKALILAQKINFRGLLIDIYKELGWGYYSKGEFEHALKNYHRAYQIALDLENQIQVAAALSNMGLVYYKQGDYPSALEYYFKAMEIYEKHGDKHGIGRIMGNTGIVYKEQGNYVKALEYYFAALKSSEELNDKEAIAIRLGNLGNLYVRQGNYKQALEYYLKALALDEELGHQNYIATDIGNIGLVYSNLNNPEKALEYYLKALAMEKAIGSKGSMAARLGNLGILYDKQGKYNQALECYFQALELAREVEDKSKVTSILANIGTLYLVNGEFIKANTYLFEARNLAHEIDSKDNLKEIYQYISALYDTTSQYVEALTAYKTYISYNDSIYNEENLKKQTRSEMTYEYEKKKILRDLESGEEERLLQQKISRRNSLQYSGIGLGLIILFIVLFAVRTNSSSKDDYVYAKKYERMIELALFISLLLLFEFLLVLLDPYVDRFTDDEPAYKLLINALLAGFIFPLHQFLESKFKMTNLHQMNKISKMTSLLWVFILVPSVLNFSFTGKKDSLKMKLVQNVSDTVRVNVLSELGKLYIDSDSDSSSYFWNQALEIAKSKRFNGALKEIHKDLSTTYEYSGQPALAFNHYKLHILYRDSVYDEENLRTQTRTELRHAQEKSELIKAQEVKEMQRKEEELKSRKNSLQYSGIALVLIVLFIGIFFLSRKFKSGLKEKNQLKYTKILEGALFISFLIFFEFVLVLLDPYVDKISGNEPAYRFLMNAILAGVIFPLHQFFERKMMMKLK